MRLSFRSGLAAATAGLLSLSIGAAPVVAADPLPVRHAVAIVRDPDIKAIVVLLTEPSGDGAAYIGGDVFGSDVHPSIIVSHQRCGVTHDPSTGRLGIFSPRDPQSGLPTVFTRPVAGLLPFIEQDARFSVRVFRTDPRREIACADFVRYGDAGDRPDTGTARVIFNDIHMTFSDRGIVLLRPRADAVRITATLPGMPTTTARIVADDAACGTPVVDPLMVWTGNVGAGLLGVTAAATGDARSITSVRLFKGTGTSRPAGCSEVIATLSPR